MGLSNISASESDRKLLNMSLVVSSARGWLAHAQEQPEELPKVRQMFMRSVRKSMHFWGLKELEDMLTHLMDPCNVCGPRYSPTHYGNQLDKIEYVTDFCLANLAMFPVGVDVWSYVFRYMLCCRLEDDRDRRWFTRMADELFNTAHYIQILAKNYKFGIEFLRSSYNDKECLYIPYRPFIMILGRLQEP